MDSPPPVGHVFFSGLNEPCSVDSLVEVVVNTKGGSSGVAPGDVSVFATSPAGIKQKCDVVRRENAFTATFTPDRIGKWLIGILYEGGHIRGSPFACQVFDASMVNVYGLDVGLIGQELGFTVDASRAGQGDIQVSVLWNARSIPASVREEPKGSNIHRIRFTPQGPGQYKVLVTFNNQPVKGSPFMLDIADSNAISVYGEQLRLAAVDRPAEFFVHSPGVQSARQISCAITGPSGKRKMARIVPQEADGTCRVEWKPSEAGEHLIDVLVNDRTAYESPFVCQVGDPDLVTVRRMPPLIEARNLHRPHTFEIDATAAGSGNLEIVINGGRVACRVRETNPRHFLAEFTPVQEAKHTVEMRFNGEHVRDSPWHIQLAGSGSAAGSPAASLERERAATRELAALRRCEQRAAGSALNGREYGGAGGVAEEFVDGNGEDIITELIGPGLNRAAVNELAHFSIHSNQRLRSSNVVVRIVERVSGRPVDVQMDERGPGTVQCEYILPRVADYALEVYINGRRMDTEPLIISGFDPRRIRVRLKEPEEFRPGKIAQFTVDAAEAGKGQLEISVNQGQVPNNVQMQDAGRCLVTFIPQHSGTYVIDVTFNGLQVHGCPIEVDVRERQVGKPVSAPVFARPAATTSVYGGSPPPPRGGSGPLERGPSSAYHSSVSPHADTASSYAPSPSSPALVARAHSQHASPAEHRRREVSAEPAAAGGGSGSGGDLRSTSLLQSAMRQREKSEPPRGLLGYTVAQYDKTTTTTHTVERRMSPLPPSRESQFGRRISSSPPPPSSQAVSPTHKYFGGTENNVNNSNNKVPPETGTAQFEMTRSAELTLLKEHPSTSEPAPIKKEPTTSPPALSEFHKAREVPYAPLDQRARRTVELLRAQQLHAAGHEAASAAGTATPTSPQPTTVEQRITIDQQQQRRFVPTHIVDPFSSDIVQADTPTTPGTRRARLQEHGVHKATDLKETALPLPSPIEGRGGSATTTDHEAESETLSSKHSSKATTPRLGLKFRGKDKSEGGGGGAFEWGKSKISSKHSVVRRGKEVEVKLDGLKLGKEDVLRVVVTPPAASAAGAPQRAAELTPAAVQQQNAPELAHRLRKTGSKTWEIGFKPAEVGTHKVLVFVNSLPHPQTPFPIRVYDAGQIVVEDIVTEATVNDTVEFTVDAGRAGFGNLEMAIKDHDGIIIPSHVSQIESGTAKFLVTFNPATAGTHTVHITFNKEVVRGSPFEVHILEPSAAQTDGATPMSSGKKKKDKKSKQPLNGTRSKSPVARETAASSPGTLTVSEPPSLSRVDRPIELFVTVTNPDAAVQAQAYDVNSREAVPVELRQDGPTTRRVVFTPRRVGDHEVRLLLDGTEVEDSPFTCRVYDPAKILVGPIADGGVDVPVKFVVDASQAGVGNLEVAVNEGKIPSTASGLGHHKYQITFVPKEPIDHTISVQFNNEPVPGSPFTCHLLVPEKEIVQQQPHRVRPISPSFSVTASGPGLERIPVGQLTEFFVDVLPDEEDGAEPVVEHLPKVQITDPRGDLLPVDVAAYEEEPTRSIVRYTPQSVGNYQVSVQYDGQSVPGSPFTVKAFDADCVKLTLDEPAKVGRSCTFTIDAAKAGAGNMEIIVSVGKRNVPNYVQAEGQARFKVSFTPQEAQEHQISVKFNGIPVPASPLRCAVVAAASSHRDEAVSAAQPAVAEGPEEEELRLVGDLASARLGEPKRFSIDVPPPHNGRVECNVVVVDPQGSPLPVRCYKQQDDSYWVEFAPEVCGSHSVEVMFGEQPVPGSPFHCEVVDPRRVQVHGVDRPFTLRTMANFIVSRKGAGNGPLAIELADPQNEQITLDRVLNSTGDESFTFLPTRLGPHKLGLKLAGFAVQGSPFSLVVEEQREPCVYGAALDYAIERGQQASMIFDPNKKSGGLKIDVRGPSGERVKHGTNRRPDDSTEISFRPQEVGNYTVDVLFNNRAVHGSPYIVAVVDPSKVLVNNERLRPVDGLLQLDAGQRNVLDVDTTGAGPVKLRVEVRDGDGELLGGETAAAEMKALDNHNKHQLLFTPPRVGKYKLYLYCSELVVPSAYPLLAIAEKTGQPAEEDRDEMSKVILRGEGLSIARVREPAEFIIDASEVHANVGKVSAALLGERADVPVKVSALRNQVYKAIYTPLMGGTYQLVVQIDSKNVPGSPSTVQVHSNQLPAELIEVDVRPLKFGVINEDLRTMIDARKATAGHLSAQCSGPTKPEYCELLDNRDGTYVLRVRPKELGRHSLTIKYDNENVPGSPIAFNVTNPPDPAKVKVYGPGIEHGILHSFKSNFVVETKGAGAGQLTVRVRGPKGAFNVEMQRDTAQERTIHCKYEPREPGDYQVEVKWHGHHVPGSPFFVLIVDTEHELQRFLAGGAPSPTPTSPFVPPGWMPPPPPPGVLPLPPIMPSPPPHFRGPHLKTMQMLPPPSPAHHQQAIYGVRHHY